jgi:regulator of sigma D
LYRSFSLFDISLGHFSLFENILKYAHFVGVPREGLEKFENLENVAED